MARFFLPLLLAATWLLTGCATRSPSLFTEPLKAPVLNNQNLVASSAVMMEDLLEFPPMIKATETSQPLVLIDNIQNNTGTEFTIGQLLATMESTLRASGKYRFVDRKQLEKTRKYFRYPTASAKVDPVIALKMGRKIQADYVLYGNISPTHPERNKKSYYSFTLKLLDTTSGILEWSAEEEFYLPAGNPLFGW